MSNRKTSKDTRNATFLPESAGGRMLSNLPSGHQLDLFGQDHAPANPFRWQGLDKALKTKGIFGRNSHDSSASANLQLSLESRLRQRLDGDGSPEYDLTWKRWDMQSGPPICALRASARRTSGNGCFGWRSPANTDGERGAHRTVHKRSRLNLTSMSQMAGWPTPTSKESAGGEYSDPEKAKARCLGNHSNDLRDFAKMAGWGTPTGQDAKHATLSESEMKRDLNLLRSQVFGTTASLSPAPMENGGGCQVAGWQTPNAMDGGQTSRGGDRKDELLLGGQAKATMPPNTTLKLNPLFSLWLMGFPAEWAYCVVPGMQSLDR
jgi:hypothetical protein